MKRCNKCLEEKDGRLFFNDKEAKDGKYSICKACKKTGTMQWREKNKDTYNAYMRKKHKETYQRDRLYRYKLAPEDYKRLLEGQKELCAICQRPPRGIRPLVIDHCHNSKKVRGLLCYGCNRAISILDNSEMLTAAMDYLNKH